MKAFEFFAKAPVNRSIRWTINMLFAKTILFGCLLCSPSWADSTVNVLTDIPYLGPDRAEKLDLYLPMNRPTDTLSPGLIWIHGGAWKGGAKTGGRATQICTAAARAGYVAVSIDYKLGEGAWPLNLQDCKNAVRFLRAKANEYRIDPERIAVTGGSAGGHLALMVGLTSDNKELAPAGPYPGVSDEVRCIVNFYGVTNLQPSQAAETTEIVTPTQKIIGRSLKIFGAKTISDEVFTIASPVIYLKETSPPILTLHGLADETVDCDQAKELDNAARAAGAQHTMLLLDGVGHSFNLRRWKRQPLPKEVQSTFLKFLASNLER